ncbi:hypothetical protein [Chryseobacterium sp.]|uniref:hypothetical protein n=1 Tax=Chryseobacterium sp. TaxID=1871047 RepID=UPI0025BF1D2A|nr:hypothetical protein [Chryseobacterium sp.]
MSVNKNILEKLSSEELEKYIQSDSRFVSMAVIYAFEILQSRGRTLTPEEQERYNALIAENQVHSPSIHPNHIKAANLIYLSGAFGIGSMIWTFEKFDSGLSIFIAIVVLGIIFGLGYAISKGAEWTKYVLLILLIMGAFGIPAMLYELKYNTVVGIINLIQIFLQLWAVILVFQIPSKLSPSDFTTKIQQ